MQTSTSQRLAYVLAFPVLGVLAPCLLLPCLFLPGRGARAEDRTGQVLFYRMLGAATGEPMIPRTRTVCSIDGEVKTSTTGMARSGFTEFPFRRARISYTFAETYAYFPRLVSGAIVDPARVNTGDILVDHVYEPDACVWGLSGREFVQTFTATRRELVSFTLLVATRPGEFRAELLEGGPGGQRIGETQGFRAGWSTEWGWCRWRAGEAPLIPGQTYGLRIRREDGAAWRPYLHATGDAYPRGELFVDGRRVPGSDLGAWIIEEPPDVTRALVESADASGWVYGETGVMFTPRSANIRLVDVTLSPAVEKCREVVARIWSTDSPAELLAGPKRNLACTTPGTVRRAQFLFARDELGVEPGARYRLEVLTIPHGGEIPSPDRTPAVPHDLRAWLYGEPTPGALPAIYNLHWSYEKKSDLRVRWSTTSASRVTVRLERLSPREAKVIEAQPGATEVLVPELWRGHDHDLQLLAHGAGELVWRTPVYRLRPPGGPHPPPPPYLYPEHPDDLPHIAPPPRTLPSTSTLLRFRRRLPVVNSSFEDGLEGWRTTPGSIIESRTAEHGVSPPQARRMAGWSHFAGQRREQVFEESYLFQSLETTPGHEYLLSVRAHTSVLNGPRGDTRVRLCADPTGGAEFTERNGTQWYWTDGRWLRFEHRFRAAGERASMGLGFFRWRDLDRASAYVDQVSLFDLGPWKTAGDEGITVHATRSGPRALVLVDGREDATDRVEAHAAAPPGHVITGLGARAAADNITTLRLRVQPLLANGTLGAPEQVVTGWEVDAGLEANVDLPAGYVATGFGARVAPEWDVKTLAVWGRPLLADGTLGEEKEFRAGVEAQGGLEKRVRLPAGRVLTSAGLRCHLNDIAGLRASSARLVRTATAAAK